MHSAANCAHSFRPTLESRAIASASSCAHHLSRCTHDQRIVGNDLAFGDECMGTDQAILANHRIVENGGANAHQDVVADGAAMQHGLMANGAVLADGEG